MGGRRGVGASVALWVEGYLEIDISGFVLVAGHFAISQTL